MNIHTSELSLMICRLEKALEDLREVHKAGGHVELPGNFFSETTIKPSVTRVSVLFPVSWERHMIDSEFVCK